MNWLRDYIGTEKQKLKGMDRKAKASYIWQYYKLWIIGITAVVLISGFYIHHRLTTPTENWFYALFANTYGDVGEGSELWEGFVDFAGYDTKEKNVVFNKNCYFEPDSKSYNEYYSAFVAYVDTGTLDVVMMETEDLATLGERGRLMDLSQEDVAELAEKYADRLIYAKPLDTEYSEEEIPIGIDLSDTCLVTKYHAYEGSCALGISAYSTHLDAVETFLDYIINEEAAS